MITMESNLHSDKMAKKKVKYKCFDVFASVRHHSAHLLYYFLAYNLTLLYELIKLKISFLIELIVSVCLCETTRTKIPLSSSKSTFSILYH